LLNQSPEQQHELDETANPLDERPVIEETDETAVIKNRNCEILRQITER
jgi:hypothetical protein